jgi:hypothetical protein
MESLSDGRRELLSAAMRACVAKALDALAVDATISDFAVVII